MNYDIGVKLNFGFMHAQLYLLSNPIKSIEKKVSSITNRLTGGFRGFQAVWSIRYYYPPSLIVQYKQVRTSSNASNSTYKAELSTSLDLTFFPHIGSLDPKSLRPAIDADQLSSSLCTSIGRSEKLHVIVTISNQRKVIQ